jgi:hypothetical protein
VIFQRKRHGKGKRDYNYQYHRRKFWIDKIKIGLGCASCGYNTHAAALDFNHLHPEDKDFLIPRFLGRGNLKRLFNEIRKCQVLCANCHRVHSREQWDTGITSRNKRGPAKVVQI